MSDDKTVLDHFCDNVKKFGDRVFMTQPMGGDKVVTYTFNETMAEAKKLAGYMESLNLKGAQIAICSKNCAYWVIADLACMMSGNVSVPVYPTLTADTTRYILEHSESKLIFIGKLDAHPWAEMKSGIPDGIPTVAFPLSPDDHGADKSWEEALKAAEPIKEPMKRKKSEMCTIIYTSGSTGQPKGVMTSFGAMVDATRGIVKLIKVTNNDRYLSYLPCAQGMERWLGVVSI